MATWDVANSRCTAQPITPGSLPVSPPWTKTPPLNCALYLDTRKLIFWQLFLYFTQTHTNTVLKQRCYILYILYDTIISVNIFYNTNFVSASSLNKSKAVINESKPALSSIKAAVNVSAAPGPRASFIHEHGAAQTYRAFLRSQGGLLKELKECRRESPRVYLVCNNYGKSWPTVFSFSSFLRV